MADKKRFGIDISRWQGNFDIARAMKNHGVQFCIVKAGGGDNILYQDPQFESNYAKCKAAGCPVGAYFYGNAFSAEAARREAEYMLTLLKGKTFEFPIWYDVEGAMLKKTKPIDLTNIINEFCSILEKNGYWVGIYSSLRAYNSEMIDSPGLARYSHWVACWGPKNPPKLKSGNDTQMWQESSSRYINGKRVDTDYAYVDYPKYIKQKGLNGFPKPKTKKKGE